MVCQVRELAAGGDGVAQLPDGRILFVPFAAPGDTLEAEVVEWHPRFARGLLLRVIEPGTARVAPRCPVFGRCGGCAWQHVAYPEQLRAKAQILRDALARIGGVVTHELPAVTPSPRAYGYRSRARLLARDGAVGFRARGSHQLCPLEACPVLAPELEAGLKELAARAPAAAAEEEWELAAGADGELRCAPLARGGVHGTRDAVELSVLGSRLRVSRGVFAQSNALLLEELARAVVEAACAGASDTARGLELHAGAGLFTLALARRFRELVAVESDPRALADLRHNLARAGASRVCVERGRAGRLLSRWAEGGERFDRVVLDPPRGGLERGAARALVALAPARIVYLSCDPATLARDARVLSQGGYRLGALRGFDLFPQTPHVEALSVWDRPGAGLHSTSRT